MDNAIVLISFGFLHGPIPDAEHVEDVRGKLHDPARVAGLLDCTGFDPWVWNAVMTTPGARELVDELADRATRLSVDQQRRIAIGCAGGRHRSVTLVEELGQVLTALRYQVVKRHRDVHHPRVIKDQVTT